MERTIASLDQEKQHQANEFTAKLKKTTKISEQLKVQLRELYNRE